MKHELTVADSEKGAASRWKDATPEDKSAFGVKGAKALWAGMTRAERSKEMRRRRRAGLKKRGGNQHRASREDSIGS